jgi:D-3-phosphoglycerate dehydrogenase
MAMKKILISTTTFAQFDTQPLKRLKKAGYIWTMNPYGRTLQPDEAVKLGKDCIGIIAGTERLNSEILHRLPYLKVISRCGVGLDNIDLDETKRRGIKVTISDSGITQAVAELALGLTLNLIRSINLMDRQLRNRRWNKIMGSLLEGKRVGIIGLGRIGKEVARNFKINGAEVVYYDPYVSKSSVPGIKRVSLNNLLKNSDIISLHLSYSKKNANFIGAKELKLMKKSTFLINCSRGGIVDEKALCDALKTKVIAGAALDVFRKEPYAGPLANLENIILTPHIGSYAKESRIKMEIQAVENLIKALKK